MKKFGPQEKIEMTPLEHTFQDHCKCQLLLYVSQDFKWRASCGICCIFSINNYVIFKW